MPPAKSAAHGARPIQGPGSAGIVPAGRGPHPPAPPGGVRAAVESGSGEYAAFRGCWGLKGRRKGLPPRAAIRAAPPQGTAGIVPAEMRAPASPASRRPARWRVGIRAPRPRRSASCLGGFRRCPPAGGRPAHPLRCGPVPILGNRPAPLYFFTRSLSHIIIIQ